MEVVLGAIRRSMKIFSTKCVAERIGVLSSPERGKIKRLYCRSFYHGDTPEGSNDRPRPVGHMYVLPQLCVFASLALVERGGGGL